MKKIETQPDLDSLLIDRLQNSLDIKSYIAALAITGICSKKMNKHEIRLAAETAHDLAEALLEERDRRDKK